MRAEGEVVIKLALVLITIVMTLCVRATYYYVNSTFPSQTPEPNDIKLDRGDYVGDITPHANFGISTRAGAGLHIHEIVITLVYF